MIKAQLSDKALIIDILIESFEENKSVVSVVGSGLSKIKKMRALMDYCFEQSLACDMAFLNETKTACVLLIDPAVKLPLLQSIQLDIKLIFEVLGVIKIFSTLKKQSLIKKEHPKSAYYHLWYIGVRKKEQGKGVGSQLLEEVLQRYGVDRTICLETSTLKNVPWYRKHGFEVVKKIDFDYKLHIMRR